jgi:hypothetical protein
MITGWFGLDEFAGQGRDPDVHRLRDELIAGAAGVQGACCDYISILCLQIQSGCENAAPDLHAFRDTVVPVATA